MDIQQQLQLAQYMDPRPSLNAMGSAVGGVIAWPLGAAPASDAPVMTDPDIDTTLATIEVTLMAVKDMPAPAGQAALTMKVFVSAFRGYTANKRQADKLIRRIAKLADILYGGSGDANGGVLHKMQATI